MRRTSSEKTTTPKKAGSKIKKDSAGRPEMVQQSLSNMPCFTKRQPGPKHVQIS